LTIGNVTLNEIIYKLPAMPHPLMVRIVEVLFREYDEFISEILSATKVYPSKSRKGLGRHKRDGRKQEGRGEGPWASTGYLFGGN
jgi:hypothetical protein